MKLSREEYLKYIKDAQPKSPHLKNFIKAVFFGGLICVLGQIVENVYFYLGLTADEAASAVSVTFIAVAAVLTGFDLYEKFGKVAGAGALVPITGFANAVASAALEYKSEGFILGMCANMFKLAGPVLVVGISVSVLYGLVFLIFI